MNKAHFEPFIKKLKTTGQQFCCSITKDGLILYILCVRHFPLARCIALKHIIGMNYFPRENKPCFEALPKTYFTYISYSHYHSKNIDTPQLYNPTCNCY